MNLEAMSTQTVEHPTTTMSAADCDVVSDSCQSASFDDVTISEIQSYEMEAVAGEGVSGNVTPVATLVTSTSDPHMLSSSIPEAPSLPQAFLRETRKPPEDLENVFCNMRKSINNLKKSPWVLSRSSECDLSISK